MLGFLQGQNSLVCGEESNLVKFAQFCQRQPFSAPPGLRHALLGGQGNEKSFETLKNDPDFQPIWHPLVVIASYPKQPSTCNDDDRLDDRLVVVQTIGTAMMTRITLKFAQTQYYSGVPECQQAPTSREEPGHLER